LVDEVAVSEEKQDRHVSAWGFYNFIRRFTDNPNKHCSFVANGQVVADLGSGPGYYALPLAKAVGPEGKVYAVDSDEKAIRALERNANKHGYRNIEAHASSAHELNFIKDKSVDFILADGLLCSIAPKYRSAAVNEMKRILKPSGKAYLAAGLGSVLGIWSSNIDSADWEKVLEKFKVERRGKEWAVVSTE
jgi:ubiquinone/menaquinone biosynthesis C-methylase UbiE